MSEHNITTTARETFTYGEHVDLARLVYKRFGRDDAAAAAAWRRLLENGATEGDFMALVCHQEHTPHCDGYCLTAQHTED